MLRKFLLLTAIVSVMFAAPKISVAATSTNQDSDDQVMPAGDRWNPWPWSNVQPFPWYDIQGLWKVEQENFTSYFSFKIVNNKSTGIRQLQVRQYDGESCRVLGAGVGIEKDKKILAQMNSRGGIIYRLELTAFSEEDLRKKDIPPLRGDIPTKEAMVLSMSPFDSEEQFHMQIVKVSTLVTQKSCIDAIRK